MSEPEDFERRIGLQLRSYVADIGTRPLAPVIEAAMAPDTRHRAGRIRIAGLAALSALIAAVVIGGTFIFARPGSDASAPATVSVGGQSYRVSIALDLDAAPTSLFAYDSMSATNVSSWFNDATVYRLDDINPSSLLVAYSANRPQESGEYRLLWGPKEDDAYPAICHYLDAGLRAASPKCVNSQ